MRLIWVMFSSLSVVLSAPAFSRIDRDRNARYDQGANDQSFEVKMYVFDRLVESGVMRVDKRDGTIFFNQEALDKMIDESVDFQESASRGTECRWVP